MPQTTNEKQSISDARRGRAYAIVKNMAKRAGYMRHERDGEGFDRFCDAFPLDHDFVDWFEGMTELENEKTPG